MTLSIRSGPIPLNSLPSFLSGVSADAYAASLPVGSITAERNAMMDSTHALSISRQAQLVGIRWGSVYYVPTPVSAVDLVLMRHLDALHVEHPFMGTRMLRDQLNCEGFTVGRKHVHSLMARMGMEALYRKPGTSKKHPGHEIYRYLLSGLTINRANQVWALDTTSIPMAKGFVYLTAVVDWASRKVLAAKVAITLETCHAVDVLHEAFTRYDTPEMVNTDQGSQCTGVCARRQRTGMQIQHGWARSLEGQCVRRASLEISEIRAGVSTCLRLRH